MEYAGILMGLWVMTSMPLGCVLMLVKLGTNRLRNFGIGMLLSGNALGIVLIFTFWQLIDRGDIGLGIRRILIYREGRFLLEIFKAVNWVIFIIGISLMIIWVYGKLVNKQKMTTKERLVKGVGCVILALLYSAQLFIYRALFGIM